MKRSPADRHQRHTGDCLRHRYARRYRALKEKNDDCGPGHSVGDAPPVDRRTSSGLGDDDRIETHHREDHQWR